VFWEKKKGCAGSKKGGGAGCRKRSARGWMRKPHPQIKKRWGSRVPGGDSKNGLLGRRSSGGNRCQGKQGHVKWGGGGIGPMGGKQEGVRRGVWSGNTTIITIHKTNADQQQQQKVQRKLTCAAIATSREKKIKKGSKDRGKLGPQRGTSFRYCVKIYMIEKASGERSRGRGGR